MGPRVISFNFYFNYKIKTKLSFEWFNIANIQSTNSDICSVYASCGGQRQYTIKQWYDHQMPHHIADKQNASEKENWAWFKRTQYYTQSSFDKYYAKIKEDKPTKLLLTTNNTVFTPKCGQ